MESRRGWGEWGKGWGVREERREWLREERRLRLKRWERYFRRKRVVRSRSSRWRRL